MGLFTRYSAMRWRQAWDDLRLWSREHAGAALVSLIVSSPAIPLAAWLGSSARQELLAIVIQSFIGPALLMFLALVVFWARAPAKIWAAQRAQERSGADMIAALEARIAELMAPAPPPVRDPNRIYQKGRPVADVHPPTIDEAAGIAVFRAMENAVFDKRRPIIYGEYLLLLKSVERSMGMSVTERGSRHNVLEGVHCYILDRVENIC